ncbi:MAG: caspase family protein [Bryobacteraceae bacterium]
MKRWAFLMLAVAGTAQTPGTPRRFELEVPGFSGQALAGDIIELPVARLNQLIIRVLEPLASRVSYSKIHPRLNFQSASVISQIRVSPQGKTVVMDLRMRPDVTLNDGANTVEITVVDENGRRYYRSWILRLREQARNEWFAYEFTRAPDALGGVPPDVDIEQPAGPVVVAPGAKARVRIRGRAAAQSALRFVTVGGAPVPFGEGATQVEFDREVAVGTGVGEVSVEVADLSGARTKVTIPVLSGQTPRTLPPTSDRLAVVIGLSRHKHGDSLSCAPGPHSAEAAWIASTLKSTGGFREDQVELLQDEAATLARIRNAIRNFAGRARPDDTVLVYFGGCGMHDSLNPERTYLAAYDSQPGFADTAVEIGELERMLNEFVRAKLMLVFDVSGSTRTGDSGHGANLIGMRLLQLASAARGRNVLVLPPMAALEETARGRPASFGASLAEALAGKADENRDNIITTAELTRYIAAKLRHETGGQQITLQRSHGERALIAMQTP